MPHLIMMGKSKNSSSENTKQGKAPVTAALNDLPATSTSTSSDAASAMKKEKDQSISIDERSDLAAGNTKTGASEASQPIITPHKPNTLEKVTADEDDTRDDVNENKISVESSEKEKDGSTTPAIASSTSQAVVSVETKADTNELDATRCVTTEKTDEQPTPAESAEKEKKKAPEINLKSPEPTYHPYFLPHPPSAKGHPNFAAPWFTPNAMHGHPPPPPHMNPYFNHPTAFPPMPIHAPFTPIALTSGYFPSPPQYFTDPRMASTPKGMPPSQSRQNYFPHHGYYANSPLKNDKRKAEEYDQKISNKNMKNESAGIYKPENKRAKIEEHERAAVLNLPPATPNAPVQHHGMSIPMHLVPPPMHFFPHTPAIAHALPHIPPPTTPRLHPYSSSSSIPPSHDTQSAPKEHAPMTQNGYAPPLRPMVKQPNELENNAPKEQKAKSDDCQGNCIRMAFNRDTIPDGYFLTPQHELPEFHMLINYPQHVNLRRKWATSMRCVMCGEDRPTVQTKKNNGQPSFSQAEYIIPRQNKGLCTDCDIAIWKIADTGAFIKWCKGCKNFRPWRSFGNKHFATKCTRCRDKQKEKYAQKVQEKIDSGELQPWKPLGSMKTDVGGVVQETKKMKTPAKRGNGEDSRKGQTPSSGSKGLLSLLYATDQI